MTIARALLASRLASATVSQYGLRSFHSSTARRLEKELHADVDWSLEQANGREMVGFGLTGAPEYVDRMDHFYPSIRFRSNATGEFNDVLQKELGDWTKLSLEEKKKLYRYSFCKTYSEMRSGGGYWRASWSLFFFYIGIFMLINWWQEKYIYHEAFSPMFHPLYKEEKLKADIDLFREPITGISSKWDYDNERWAE